MKKQVKERIVENNGTIISENDNLIKAEFSYREMQKAVKVFFELTNNLNQDAVLHGGCRLTVYYSNSKTESAS
jgi:hypothetical protein